MIKDKILLARQMLERCQLDGFVFYHLPNIRFLCGFTGSDGVLVVTRDSDCFLTDSRYTTQAADQVRASEIRTYKVKEDGVAGFLEEQGTSSVGFEADTLPYGTFQKLQEKCPSACRWQPVTEEVRSLRGIKDTEEVKALEEATALNAEALEEVLPQLRPGVTEREFALALEFALKRRGGEEKAFDFIVASGERGALPHGVASDRALREGELVTIDFGTRVRGYHSDETVTLALGAVPSRLEEIFAVVLEAHDRAMDRVAPGVALKELDAVAREYIAERGYGDYFGHGLGHGVGLEVHEYPVLSPRSADLAAEGMVITIEPGVYLPGVGGVRIEDMVLVTADGYRRLTRIPKEFRSLPV